MTHPDIETIRAALYSGQISAAKVDAQRAFERVAARLNHYMAEVAPAESVPRSATVVAAWDDIKELFHSLWGKNASGKYDKSMWKSLQARLWRVEAATEALGPAGRENLVSALKRIELPVPRDEKTW